MTTGLFDASGFEESRLMSKRSRRAGRRWRTAVRMFGRDSWMARWCWDRYWDSLVADGKRVGLIDENDPNV